MGSHSHGNENDLNFEVNSKAPNDYTVYMGYVVHFKLGVECCCQAFFPRFSQNSERKKYFSPSVNVEEAESRPLAPGTLGPTQK